LTKPQNILFSLLLLLISTVHSQSFEHRKFKYDWKDALKITFKQEDKYNDYGAVILFEETTLDIELKNIKRYQVFQFNDSVSIEKYNLFRVPISMDSRQSTLLNLHRPDTNSFPELLYEKINFFDARIIRNGEFVKAVLDETAYRMEERTGEYLVPYYVHYFFVRNLEPGDQLEVVISHQWPLNTFKYYLNEVLPKQEALITVHNSPLGQVDAFVNSNLAAFIGNDQSEDGKTYRMAFEDLEAVDPAIPTNIYSLPRVEFFENKKYMITNRPFGIQDVDTLSWQDVLYNFVTRIDPAEMRTWEYYDLQSYKTSLFFTKMKEMAGENIKGTDLMNCIHQYAVDKLGYKNDFHFFIHNEHGFPDLGSYLERDTLREVSRHDFYYKMLDRVDIPYYRVFLQDHRLQITDTSKVGIFYDDYLSYVTYNKDSSVNIYYPKKGRTGYYTNELPFYLTGQYAYLIPQTVPRKIYDREPGSIRYPLHYFIPNDPKKNIKRNVSVVNISLEKNISNVVTHLKLSGQYSTLLRGYYLYGDMDTTISTSYYANVWKKMSEVKIKTDSLQKTFPFEHDFTITGSGWQNVYSTVDGTYVIDLTDLINIHYENLNPQFFRANYRHDFEGKEEHIIELNFDKLVTIENMGSFTHEVNADGFMFSTILVKIADNQYGLKIEWLILDEQTKTDQLDILKQAFDLIKQFNKCQLRVKQL
jgi:hypothetical protein